MYRKSLSTKEKILLSATKLLNEKDIGQISIANVAKEAGVAVGLINYHFDTKEKLLYSAIEFYIIKMISKESESISSIDLEPKQQLFISLKGFGDFLANHSKICRLYYISNLEQENNPTILQIGYEYYIPILQKLYPDKSKKDLVFIIYPIVCAIQMMFLGSAHFKMVANMDFFCVENRHAMIKKLIDDSLNVCEKMEE